MIQRLLETSQSPRRASRIDQRIRDHLVENFAADVMGAGKGCEQSIRRKHFESANVQLAIPSQSVVQTAFALCEGRRIENDEIELFPAFSARAQKLKNILLHPAHRNWLRAEFRFAARMLSAPPSTPMTSLAPARRAGERESALTAETIEHPSSFRMFGDEGVIRQLVQIEAGFLRMQEIDF